MKHSSISKISLEGREFLVKRDDLIDRHLAGNKYRKLYTLLQTPKEKYTKIISYGGTQSNAMLALAALCQQKSWEFIYYTKPLSGVQKENEVGNYYEALTLGMKHIEIEQELYKDFIASLRINMDDKTSIVDQGGADQAAQKGLEVLAQEVRAQKEILEKNNITSLATPSGTGTTALFLALSLPEYTIYTTPSIGDKEYLQTQMLSLVKELPKNLIILEPKRKYHFAKLYKEFYELYNKLKDSGIEFDLLYAPQMWQTLLEQTTESILYIHSGGVTGNASMLARYAKKFNAT
ncbi:1-aminocyclopropane-1-carboxylate deaminase [Sulfurimonas marina]|uniref:1-aminocyclopropane-1-carboxylate deaminase n=1 Tax=Sulfurimonas marina TaxID=2590551 RepID=A0A7M1AVM5_9BACT|nr:1-aminocyclopropane-1-carboxylate deaminase [Sulfurimonas marina]QOP40638.1 1-aminocyclopropane-1-carboxylate deaminase [Sulfurimonas marina]